MAPVIFMNQNDIFPVIASISKLTTLPVKQPCELIEEIKVSSRKRMDPYEGKRTSDEV